MGFIEMYDTVDVSTVPPNPAAVAGYVGGFWPTFSPLVQAFPKAHHLSIAVSASEDAETLDVENGDAVAAEAPTWVLRQMHRGVKQPCLYTFEANVSNLVSALSRGGLNRSEYRLWIAHWTYDVHVAANETLAQKWDGVQFTDHALGRNLDESIVLDTFFVNERIPVVNKYHYERFQKGPFLLRNGHPVNELSVVVEYDGLRKHPFIHRARLAVLREQLAELAGRIYSVSHGQPASDGRPSWGQFWRGWRFQQLIHRSQGMRFV